jgi:hypothetical protein
MLWLTPPGKPSPLGAICHRGKLQNSVHHILPQQKKGKFKASGVKKDVPRIEMVQHQDMTVELSIHLLAA